ncbi:hypothetical protein DY000_02017573 [Brassica cretica]|uniref:Uncharacterized protein n=1 Tax=Brassica cretica TaxID=69181 RepID=A0ABQ7D628_BRACR|nr:hypothetical protein DY000_02017573 [Brassica cretica]
MITLMAGLLCPEETDLVGRLSHSPVSFSLSKVISSPSSPIYAPRSSKITAGAQAQGFCDWVSQEEEEEKKGISEAAGGIVEAKAYRGS